jgi:F0F1-type ATP synthase assembly protein I
MNDNKKPLIGAGIMFQLSFAIVIAMLAPLLIGIWIDRTFNTGPICLLLLMVVGVALGSLTVYRIVKDAYDQLNAK